MAVQTAWYSYEDAIQLAEKDVFLSPFFLNQLAKQMLEKPMSRRKRAEWISDHLNALDGKFDVFDEDKQWMDFHDEIVSEAFGHDEAFTYLSAVLRFAANPARQKSSGGMLLRFQLLAIAFLREGDPITL